MELVGQINLNYLRVFEAVYRNQSMTTAARELHLTQSGVSQHIRSLEETIGVRLFDRIQQRLVPTSAAQTLFQHCSRSLADIELALSSIRSGATRSLSGSIAIGMPIEFGNNVVMPLLAKFSRKHPQTHLKVKFDFAPGINEMLLKGELDFGFVDEFRMDQRITTQRVYDEILELCISEELLNELQISPLKDQRKYFESLPYVDYQDQEPILRMWFAHHLGTQNLSTRVRATVMDAEGLARLIVSGVGAGVLPSHLVTKLRREGASSLHRFKGRGKPLTNSISVAYLGQRTQSPAAAGALTFLRDSLTSSLGD